MYICMYMYKTIRKIYVILMKYVYSRKAGVQLGAQLLDRKYRVLILGVRFLRIVVHAFAQTMTG